MARAEIDWAQGYSEPNAGTDLASLQTRGVEDGDDIVVTGQKIWSSGSHFSNWYHILVRTDPNAPKHRGITYLAMQLTDDDGKMMPGITLRPLFDFFGTRRWNEVFMDEVRVPKRYMIGEMNRGWYAAMTTLNFERTGIDNASRQIGIFDRFIAMARDLRFNGEPILDNPVTRHQLADLRVTLEIDRMLAYRVAAMQAAGEVPQAEGAMSGWRILHTSKYWMWPTFARALGPYVALLKGEHRAPGNGIYGTNYMLSQNESGGGGGIASGRKHHRLARIGATEVRGRSCCIADLPLCKIDTWLSRIDTLNRAESSSVRLMKNLGEMTSTKPPKRGGALPLRSSRQWERIGDWITRVTWNSSPLFDPL